MNDEDKARALWDQKNDGTYPSWDEVISDPAWVMAVDMTRWEASGYCIEGLEGDAGAGGAEIDSEGLRSLRIVAHGEPAAQGSKKHVGNGRMIEMSKKLPKWRAAVEAAARLAAGPSWEPIDGPVSIDGEIRLRKPKSTKFQDHPAGPPDADKLIRAVGDALTASGVITDDARVVHWCIRKVWATELPGMDIEIRSLT